jgi:secreted trypsin-like serine protease
MQMGSLGTISAIACALITGEDYMLHCAFCCRTAAFAVAVTVLCFSSAGSAQDCRDRVATRIVGGNTAQLRHWPGQAVLRARGAEITNYFCGGAAISDRWILTAAHCMSDVSADGTSPDGTVEAVLGVADLNDVRKDNVYAMDRFVIREGYTKPEDSGQDIALIHLKRPYSGPTARLSLEAATDPQTPPGAQVRVAGFGSLRSDAASKIFRGSDGRAYSAGSRRLLEASVPTVAMAECKAHYAGKNIDDGQVCAGLEQGGRDSCQGDSGGPLVAYDRNGCPYQIGIVSWGIGCAGARDYGVYTRVSSHSEWIKKLTGPVRAVTVGDLQTLVRPTLSNSFSRSAASQLQEILSDARGRVRIGVKGGNRIKLGREVVFVVRSDIGGRLIVVDIGANGEVIQLLPNQYTPAHQVARVSPGADLTIPGPDYGFSGFRAMEPAGKGQLIALVVPENFPEQAFASGTLRTRTFAPVNTPTSYLMNLVQSVRSAVGERSSNDRQLANWGLGVADYEIID